MRGHIFIREEHILKNKILKSDIILICAALILAAALLLVFLPKNKGAFAVVYSGGKEVARLPLSEDVEIDFSSGDGGHNVLVIRGGEASVAEASCKDKICVHHAPTSKDGEKIICLPNRFVVSIEGTDDE